MTGFQCGHKGRHTVTEDSNLAVLIQLLQASRTGKSKRILPLNNVPQTLSVFQVGSESIKHYQNSANYISCERLESTGEFYGTDLCDWLKDETIVPSCVNTAQLLQNPTIPD